MNNLKAAILSPGKNLEKQNMIWNMIGSFCYAFASMVLSFLVMRIIGKDQGGVFAFAFSTFGQQLFLVAYFGVRPYQVTDGKGEFTFGDYLIHRQYTTVAAVAVGVMYLSICGYSAQKAAVVFLMVLYKVIDGFADVYESEFQRSGRLYLTGKSNTFRTLLSVALFLAALVATRQLVFSCMVAVAGQAAGVVLFDLSIMKELSNIDYGRRAGSAKALFRNTTLLFLSVFLDFYIFSASKYAIDAYLNDASSGYFNVIFMPTSVINLAAGFVIRPFLTSLTEYWDRRRFKDFSGLMGKLLIIICGLTLLAGGGGWLLGKPVLGILERILGPQYEQTISGYRGAFTAIVLGGGFYAVMNLMYYALVIMRKQVQIFLLYGAVAVIAYFLSANLVNGYGINGAAVSYLILMVILSIGFAVLTLAAFKKGRQNT